MHNEYNPKQEDTLVTFNQLINHTYKVRKTEGSLLWKLPNGFDIFKLLLTIKQ